MSYTIHNSEAINARIESDLEIIKSVLINEFGNKIISLILIGGFTRGEGSVLIENEFVRPLIDYDIVFVGGRIDNAKLGRCSEEIVEKIGLEGKNFHIDLIPMSVNYFKKLPFTQFNYDLKYTGKVFYGDEDILSLIPKFDAEKMPLETARFLLFNRMINFIYTISYDFINKRLPTDEESLLLKYQCLKNVLDAGTALLILYSKYSPSYRVRNDEFKKLFSDKEDWVKFHQKATDFKLDPTNNILDVNPGDLWFQTKKIYEEMFRSFISQMYKKKFNDWIEFVKFYEQQNRWKLIKEKVAHGIFTMKKHSTSTSRLELLEILIVFAISKDSINLNYLHKAINMLGYNPRESNEFKLWNNVRYEVVRRYYKNLGREFKGP